MGVSWGSGGQWLLWSFQDLSRGEGLIERGSLFQKRKKNQLGYMYKKWSELSYYCSVTHFNKDVIKTKMWPMSNFKSVKLPCFLVHIFLWSTGFHLEKRDGEKMRIGNLPGYLPFERTERGIFSFLWCEKASAGLNFFFPETWSTFSSSFFIALFCFSACSLSFVISWKWQSQF